MYRCDLCGTAFDEPYINEYSEPRQDCFRERFKQVLCPVCMEPYFTEIEEDEDGQDQ